VFSLGAGEGRRGPGAINACGRRRVVRGGAGEQPSTNSVVTEGLALLIWCYYDGIVGHLSWGLAAVEALLRLRLAQAWANSCLRL